MTANEAIADAASAQKDRLREAENFLSDYLGGPKSADDVKEAAKAYGIKERTLRRAREKLGVVISKQGFLMAGNGAAVRRDAVCWLGWPRWP